MVADIFLFLLLILLCVLHAIKTSCICSTNNTVEASVCGFIQDSEISSFASLHECRCAELVQVPGAAGPVKDPCGLRQDSALAVAELLEHLLSQLFLPGSDCLHTALCTAVL